MILLSLLGSTLIGTIIIELFFAFVLGVRDKNDFLNIILSNIMTNPLLVIFTLLIKARYGNSIYYLVLFIMEIVAVLIEERVYDKYLNYKKIRAYKLSLILNLSSFLIGLVFNYI